ncbi:VOC family protein [Effusibacillus consociatus]|uniref:VOC family protein n=1 Tax=Effusibacillus consociatus TaxID=1117041 RepID=A0ABV9Q0T7_9BACL
MEFAVTGIDHIQLAAPVGCEEEARYFYGEILGMQELKKPELLRKRGGVWFRCGDRQLHSGVEADFRPAKKTHPAFRVKDVERLKAHLPATGFEVQDDDALSEAKRFYVEDPFGNRLEFLEWRA